MNKNEGLLKEFSEYCAAQPEQRFWQALRNWSDADVIEFTNYWEGKDESGIRAEI